MKGKITVIDDDSDLRSLLQIALRIEGFDVKCFTNAASYLEVQNSHEFNDMFIIDVNLGGMTGYELCRVMREHPVTRAAKVILISANPEVQQFARECSADDYILKPFTQKDLIKRVAKLLSTN